MAVAELTTSAFAGPVTGNTLLFGVGTGSSDTTPDTIDVDLLYDYVKSKTDLVYPTIAQLNSVSDVADNALNQGGGVWLGESKRATDFADATLVTDLATYGQLQNATITGNFDLDALTAIGTLDSAADKLLIWDDDVSAYKSATPAQFTTGLLPLTTRGDIMTRGASTNDRLAVGATDEVLISDGTDPAWGTVNTNSITASAVTYAKIQNVSATSRLLGRVTAGAGDVEELTAANTKTILGLATSTTDNTIVRFDSTAGNTQTSSVTIDDSDNIAGLTTITIPNTGLHILDTDASHDVIIAPGSNITADRTFTLTTGDADRTLDISAGSVTISVAGAALIDDANAAAQLTTLGAQAQGDILDDFNTLGAATTDGEFIVATGAGAFAFETGATVRTSLGLGTGDSPTFTALTLAGDLTDYVATNDGNPQIRLGAADAEELHIQAVYDTGAQTLDYVLFQTDAASATADKGLYRFNVDGTAILDIDDGGVNLATNMGVSINGTDILTDSSGTATLSNIDAIDATTEATIEAAIDTLANLTSIQGNTVTLTGNFIRSGAHSLTLTTTATTSVTLPTSGTLAVIGGNVYTGTHDFGGADDFEIPNSATPTVDTDGQVALDTTVTDFSHGVVKYFGGEEMAVISVPIAQLTSPTDNYAVMYDAAADEFQLKDPAASAGATAALDNLAGVAINTSLISDTDITDDIGTGDIRWSTGFFARLDAGLTAADTLVIGARDVDGAAYTDFITLTSNNTPTCNLSSSVTIGSDTIVSLTGSQTLTNKTLTSPVFATNADLNGVELILDTDADTSITADTDDQIDIRIAGADDFQLTANTLTALTGSTINSVDTGGFTENSVAITPIGQHTIWIPAGAMEPRVTTAPAAFGTVEIGTSLIALRTMDFATDADDHAGFGIQMPKGWDESTLVAQFVWSTDRTQGAGNDGVRWFVRAGAYASDDVLTTALGTAVGATAQDHSATANDIMITSETAAITVAGSPGAEEWVYFEVYRDVSDAGDDLDIDARLHGVKIHYTLAAATDD